MTAEDLLTKVMRTYSPNAFFKADVTEDGAIEAMKEYAQLKCKEQREICSKAESLKGLTNQKVGVFTSHEPKFD